jgi:CheY-like chemotaxis protein
MEAVGRLTGGIAPDFNNLLGAIVGSLDLIRRKPEDLARVKRFADAGLEAAERGAKLTGQLLAFSRSQRIELKPVLVVELVSGMRELLARTLGPLIRLHFMLDDPRAPVLSDQTQLEMAVLNLAINSRDAMPDGGDLTIATAVRHIEQDLDLPGGDYVELSVTDTGSGMPPEIQVKAFDPFFTTKGVGEGTGLGLSQVYGIARQAGGTVRIESEEGWGTIVRLYLPLLAARPSTEAEPEGRETAKAAARVAAILVVDDDPDLRQILVASLETLGYTALAAEDGAAGLEALKQRLPDLVVVDFAMPGMNGAEFAIAARRLQPSLPIIFASGYAETAAIEKAAGAHAVVLRKPFRIEELETAVAAALNEKAG